MAAHSSILAWRILWTEEPGELQSIGSQRVGHDRVTEHELYKVETPLVKMNSEHLSLSDSIFSGSMVGSLSGKTMIFNHMGRIRKIPLCRWCAC